jgi:hypothetical protein
MKNIGYWNLISIFQTRLHNLKILFQYIKFIDGNYAKFKIKKIYFTFSANITIIIININTLWKTSL